MDANTKRGIIGNLSCIVILGGLSTLLGIKKYAAIAVGIQWLVYLLHGLPFQSEKFYDASGSLTHLTVILASLLSASLRHPRQIINSVLVVIWLTRLGSFLFTRICADGKDDRFTEIKESPLRFLSAWSIQALWVFLIDLPVVIINSQAADPEELGLTTLDYLGFSLWAFGFLFEVIADAQKAAFRANPDNKGKFITVGLWACSRHPNYFGEMIMWSAICVSCASAWTGAQWFGLLSPVFTVFLLTKVSGVPMLEKSGLKKWGDDPAYQHYMAHTSCIVPMAPAPAKAD